MKTYGFDFIDAAGRIHSVDVATFASDAEATQHARKSLFASLTSASVDVWDEGRRVAHVSRAVPTSPMPSEPRRFFRKRLQASGEDS